MWLLLEIAPEAVCSQHLKRAEKHEEPEPLPECFFIQVRNKFPRSLDVGLNEFVLQILRISRPGLPDEGCHVIICRSPPATLKINEIRLTIPYHHVPRLEVPVHECGGILRCQILPHRLKILLQADLVEFQTRRLQKAVFEIIEVEENHPAVELGLGEADIEVQTLRSVKLDLRKQADCLLQDFPFFRGVIPALPPSLHQVIEQCIPQILLEIAHPVPTDRQDLRDIDSTTEEM